jgi:hypothetical protein
MLSSRKPAASSRSLAVPRAVRKNPLRVAGDPVPVIGVAAPARSAKLSWGTRP